MFRTDLTFFRRALRAPARVTGRAGLAVLLVGATVAVLEVPTSVSAAAATIVIVNGDGSTTPSTLAGTLLAPGLTLSGVPTINGDSAFTAGDQRLRSYGTFSNGTSDVGIGSGLVIAANADAHTFATGAYTQTVSGDRPDLALGNLLVTQPGLCNGGASSCIHNATDLAFSVVPNNNFIKFDYTLVFTEVGTYNTTTGLWSGNVFNYPDGFGLFVNGESPANNCAAVPSSGAYLTMKTAGIVAPQGNEAANRAAALATVAPNQKFAYAAQNPSWAVQFLTVPLTCVVDVSAQNAAATPVSVRIVVADANDNQVPPAVFLTAGSVRFEATASPVWTDFTLGGFQVGTSYSDGVHASGGPLPTYTLTAGGLPAGISLDNTTGAVTGTPTTAGAYDFTITVANGTPPDLTKQFTGTVVEAPTWTDNTIVPFQVGVAVNDGVLASGTPTPTYSISAGGLPAGLSFNTTTGALTGTPTSSGAYNFTLRASNGIGSPVIQAFSGSVSISPTWTDQSLGPIQINVAYTDGVSATGPPAPTYSLSAGVLPAGLLLNTATGAVTGTPSAPGAYDFTITAANGNLPDLVKQFTGNVAVPPAWTDLSLGTMRVGVLYADGVNASGTPAPTYSISAGLLPAGLVLNGTTGAITGTPTVAGEYDFTITTTNGFLPNLSWQINGVVVEAPTWTDQAIGAIQVGVPFADGVLASGTPTPTYSITAGTLPAGLAMNGTTGAITGTPTTSAAYTFTVRASNGVGASITHVFSGLVSISPAWTDQSIGTIQINVAYSDGVSASGNPAPTYSVSAGLLPTGLSLNTATGAITGTPTVAGAYNFTISASNGSAPNVVVQFTGNVAVPPVWVDQNITLAFQVGTVVNDGVSASGTPTPTYSITAGTLPAGLALDSATGAITGTPTASGNYSFTVAASNGIGSPVTHVFSGLVSIAPAWVDQTLGTMQVGTVYTDGVSATANPAPTYSVSAGILPLGLSLNTSTGAITGSPTTAGASNFTITVANGSLPNLVKQFISTVVQAPTWTDQTINNAFQVGILVTDGVAATGTPAPTYSITAGTLPAGLALNATTGAITGTPTASGNYSFTVSASNGIGTAVTHVFSGLVSIAPAWTDQTLGTIQVGTAYDDGVSASSDPAPTYSIFAGVLPAGLSLNTSTGAITGTPTTAGPYTFTIRVANGSLPNLVQQFTSTVVEEPTWTDDTIAAAFQMDVAVNDGVSATGTPVPTYSISAGTLPAGLALDAVTGAITGTPTVGGAYSFTLSAGNGIGIAATKVFTGTVAQPAGGFLAINPVRLLDTRDGGDKLVDHTVRHLSIAGLTGIPADATSVVLNITVDHPSSAGFVTAYPCGGDVPLASNLNFLTGQTIANSAVVRVGTDNTVCFYVSKATDLIVDVNGSYSPSSAVGFPTSAHQQRLLDTRETGSAAAQSVQEVDLNNVSSVPANATSVTLNVTVDGPQRSGFITVYPCSSGRPLASNVNFVAGQTVANSVTVPVGANHTVCVFTTAATDLVIDLNEVYSTVS